MLWFFILTHAISRVLFVAFWIWSYMSEAKCAFIWMMSKTVCNKTRLSSLFINYLAFWVSLMGLTVAILWKSGTNPTILYELRQTSCFGSYIYLLLTSQKSNEVNWKAIKSIPWAVHDLPNWHDLKSKLISKLRQNTVSSWLVRNSKCFFFPFLIILFAICDFTLLYFICFS